MWQLFYLIRNQIPLFVSTTEWFRLLTKMLLLLVRQSEMKMAMENRMEKSVRNSVFLVLRAAFGGMHNRGLTLTSAPITPRLVNLRYSNGRVFDVVCKNGYRNNGIWACRNTDRVSGCEATHCNSANALHTRFDWWAVNVGGLIDG